MNSNSKLARFTNAVVAKTLLLTILLCMLAGCTGSVHPLLTHDDLVEDMDLSGEWDLKLVGADGDKDKANQKVILKLEKYATSTYDATIIPDPANKEPRRKRGGTAWPDAWTLQIGKIKGQLFAQMIPRDAPMGPPLTAGIPVYVFGRLEVEADKIKLYGLLDTNAASVADHEKLQHITYEPSEFVELTVFTMPTVDLQQAVVKHQMQLFNREPAILLRRSTSSK